jgi:ketosteroid isomerase-like protein
MSVEENKAVVRRLLEAVNQQDLATIDALAAPEVARSTKEELIPSGRSTTWRSSP